MLSEMPDMEARLVPYLNSSPSHLLKCTISAGDRLLRLNALLVYLGALGIIDGRTPTKGIR